MKDNINVIPHPQLMALIGDVNFSISEAISELIANSMDARLEDEPVKIIINADIEHISVLDHGIGMEREVLEKAVRMAWPMDTVKPYGKKAKRKFGLGMKTACASLGNKWQIITKPIDGKAIWSIEFNLPEWKKKSEWKAQIKQLNSVEGLDNWKHGTIINIDKLKVKPIKENLIDEISRAYQPHIRSKDEIIINNTKLKEREFVIIDGTKIEIATEFKGVKVEGWGALREVGSITDYGFNWYKRDQLVEAYDKQFVPHHPTYRQIIGELYTDNMPVNFTKKGFRKESIEWKQINENLEEEFKDLLKMARKSTKSKKEKRGLYTQQRVEKTQETLTNIGYTVSEIIEGDTKPLDTNILDDSYTDEDNYPESIKKLIRKPLIIGKTKLFWRHRFEALGEEGNIYDYMIENKDDKNLHLLIVSNKDSPFTKYIQDDEKLIILNVSKAILEFLLNEFNFDFLKASELIHLWLINVCEKLNK